MLRGSVVPIAMLRWRARLPRLALVACCSILSIVGLSTIFGGKTAAPAAPKPAARAIGSIEGFAEGFARVYTAPASDLARRARELKSYGFDDTASAPIASGVGIRAAWSAVVASQTRRGGGRTVTVSLHDGRRAWYFAVPVGVDRTGRRFVPSPPALVGPPAVRLDAVGRAELEVGDADLRQVVERVIRHYLASDRVDLAADLARGAPVSLPPTPTRLVDVGATTWVARPSRVAVSVTASAPGGVRLLLRYELQVSRIGGRWLVRGIQVNPLDREQHP